jgi:hypothetical protein
MEQSADRVVLLEKRYKPRINCSYPAIIRGYCASGKKFEESGTILNLGPGGAYLTVNRTIDIGQDLSVRIAFPTGSLEWGSTKLATAAVVVRTEPVSEGVLGVAIKFQHYRFV